MPAFLFSQDLAKEIAFIKKKILFSLMQLRTNCRNMVVAGFILIWLIKLVIRPYVHVTGFSKLLLGIAPNLLGAYLIPFGAYWLYTHPRFFNGRLLRFSFFSETRFVCLFGFSLALSNEYLQLIPVFGRTFDLLDILFSGVGLITAYYSFIALQRKYAVLG